MNDVSGGGGEKEREPVRNRLFLISDGNTDWEVTVGRGNRS